MKIRNLFRRHRELNGYPAVIDRKGQSCTAIVTLATGQNQSVTAGEAERANADRQDIMVAAVDYKPTGVPTPPGEGDTITITIEGVTTVHDVRPRGDNEQCYGTSNAEGDQLRVFCVIRSQS